MAFQTKKSVMAIVRETTEGIAVAPSSGNDFIAIQEGFEVTPGFATLENTELTGSIGQAKPVQGFEEPTVSISHYLRHSGVEGTEPDQGLLYEAAFGAKDVNSTEFDAIAGSTAGDSTTAATIVVDSGEGVNFERGEALLIKDATNGFSIRPVQSVSGDTLTLGFNLDNAPAATTNLGKAVLYKPGESHPTLTVWDYRANNAAIQTVAGSRVTEMTTEIAAGELLNSSFSLEGINFSYDGLEVTSSNDDLDFVDDGGTKVASMTNKLYKDPIDLAEEISSKMNAASVDVITVTYSSSTGKYTLASDGSTFSLLWDSGGNTATTIGELIGFDTSADDTGSLTYTGDNAITLAAEFTPVFDSSNPLVAKDNIVFLGTFSDNVCFSTRSVTLTISDEKSDELDVCAESGKSGSVITARTATIEMVADLQQFEVDKFNRFRENTTTRFLYNFGTKSAGNFEAGKSGCIYMPTAVISNYNLSDNDGLVTLDMTLNAFVESGLGEVYLNFL